MKEKYVLKAGKFETNDYELFSLIIEEFRNEKLTKEK